MGIWELKLSQTVGSQECIKISSAGTTCWEAAEILRRTLFPILILASQCYSYSGASIEGELFSAGAVPVVILNGKYEVAIPKDMANI